MLARPEWSNRNLVARNGHPDGQSAFAPVARDRAAKPRNRRSHEHTAKALLVVRRRRNRRAAAFGPDEQEHFVGLPPNTDLAWSPRQRAVFYGVGGEFVQQQRDREVAAFGPHSTRGPDTAIF